jgi:hypothetical protein
LISLFSSVKLSCKNRCNRHIHLKSETGQWPIPLEGEGKVEEDNRYNNNILLC